MAGFVAVHPRHPLEAAAFALAFFELAGEIVNEKGRWVSY
jgi:hypothetical protein